MCQGFSHSSPFYALLANSRVYLDYRRAYLFCLPFSVTKDQVIKVAKVCTLVYISEDTILSLDRILWSNQKVLCSCFLCVLTQMLYRYICFIIKEPK